MHANVETSHLQPNTRAHTQACTHACTYARTHAYTYREIISLCRTHIHKLPRTGTPANIHTAQTCTQLKHAHTSKTHTYATSAGTSATALRPHTHTLTRARAYTQMHLLDERRQLCFSFEGPITKGSISVPHRL